MGCIILLWHSLCLPYNYFPIILNRWGCLGKYVCVCLELGLSKLTLFSNGGSTLFIRLNLATYFSCLGISGDASNYDVIISSWVIVSFFFFSFALVFCFSSCCWLAGLFLMFGGRDFSSEMNVFFLAKNFKKVSFVFLFTLRYCSPIFLLIALFL